MKRVWICLALTVIMILLAIGSYLYTCSVTVNIEDKIDLVRIYADKKDYEKALIISSDITEEWKSYCINHIFVTDHEHTMEIATTIARIEAFAANESDDIMSEIYAVKELLRHYRENQSVTPANIF